MGLVDARPDRLQRRKPFVARAARVKGAFFLLGRGADARLDRGVRDGHEMPGLVIGPDGAVPAAAMQAAITDSGTGRVEYCRTEWRLRMWSRKASTATSA